MLFYCLYFFLIFSAMANPLQGDGKLRLFNYHLQEFLEISFKQNNHYDQAALSKINQLLRSRDNQQSISIQPQLLDIIDHLQDRFAVDTIEIISGYRSPELNNQLLSNGHKVSPVSLHKEGRALDIHIDEIHEETLRDYIKSIHPGGVGYYGSLDFIHVDLGEKRYWEDTPNNKRKLIGVLLPDAVFQLTVLQNNYALHETIIIHLSSLPKAQWDAVLSKPLRLEKFYRGKWLEVEKDFYKKWSSDEWGEFTLPAKKLETYGFGKYRIVFNIEASLQSSNEFYLKKQ